MAALCRHVARPGAGRRALPTISTRSISLQTGVNDPELVADSIAAYPYGSAKWYKQSDRGLYGGQKKMYGNNTSEEFQTRKRRAWSPSVVTKRLYSEALQQSVHLRVTTRVLRTIDKVGGLDNYLLGHKEARIKELGETGWWLKWAIMQTPHIRERFATEESVKLQDLGMTEEQAREGLSKLLRKSKKAASGGQKALDEQSDSSIAATIDSTLETAPKAETPAIEPAETRILENEDSLEAKIEPDLASPTTDAAIDVETTSTIPEPKLRSNRTHRGVRLTNLARPFSKGLDLRFRVDNEVYLQLSKSGWNVGRPRAVYLKRKIKAHSPVHVIKRWEPVERESVERLLKLREKAPEQAATEIAQFEEDRANYFAKHRRVVRKLTEELRQTGKVV